MATVPGIPTITAFTLSPRSDGYFDYTIAYTPPANDGGSPILEYEIEIGTPFASVSYSIGLANPYTRSSEQPGTPDLNNVFNASYRARLRARNAIGWGDYTTRAQAFANSSYYTTSLVDPTTVRVSFNPAMMPAPPKSTNPLNDGDALKLFTWRLANNAGTGSVGQPTAVTKIDDYTFDLSGVASSYSIIGTRQVGAMGSLQLTNGSLFKVLIVARDLKPTAPVLISYSTIGSQVTLNVTSSTKSANDLSAQLQYDYSLDGGITFTPTSITPSFTVSGLTIGETYNFQLRSAVISSDWSGSGFLAPLAVGEWSNVLPVVPGASLPGIPTINSVTGGIGELTVAYTAPSSDGGAPITSYEYRVLGVTTNIGLTNPFSITGLAPGITLAVDMRAVNALGPGPWSAPVSGTTFSLPTAPTITSVTPGNAQLSVAFTPPSSNGGAPITAYEYSVDGGSNFSSVGTTSPILISGLTNGVTYNVILRAVTGVGAGPWSAPVAGTPVSTPSAPTIDSITPTANTLTVVYTASANDGGSPITDYEYSLDNGATYTSAGLLNPFAITGLANSTLYQVTLRAVNAIGPSSNSATVPAMTPTTYQILAVGDRVARITFDAASYATPPLHVSSTGLLDALNPRTWQITQFLETVPATSKTLTILSVLGLDAYTYEICTLESFARANGPHLNLSAPAGLKLENGTVIAIASDSYADFSGAIQSADATPNSKTAARGYSVRDIANVPTPYEDLIGGTLVINSAGDYSSMSGEQFIRKLVMRRLISKRGDFFHLPNYGAGLGVKETFSTANLRIMAKDIEMQVLLEPEIEQAKATLTYQAADSTLTVQVRARMRSTGQITSISMRLAAGSIQF